MRRHAAFAVALLLDLIGAGGALLVSTRAWQTVTTPQPAPRHDDVLDLSGRTVDAAPTALALVALAGVVAVLATRGIARRIVGGVLALAGAGLVWRAIACSSAVSAQRARSLVSERHRTVEVSGVVPQIATHGAWPVLTLVGGVLVAAAGGLIAWRGHCWQAMSARYEAPPTAELDDTRAAATLWTALDRGEDPTEFRR
jgi:uncharacterized membrane protein (TIGR02234 family)